MDRLIRKYALQNAVFYNGKADAGAVLGKVLAENPDLRKNVNNVRKQVEKAVSDVNKLSPEEQRGQLEGIDKKLLSREVKKQEGLPPLRDARMGKVVTRFAPCPSGPLNLLHALRAVLLSYAYARQYKGKFYLRFEDTDPRVVEKSYYKMIEEDLAMLEARPDRVFIESRDMKVFYKYAEELIKRGVFYVDFTSAEDFRRLKKEKGESAGRNRPAGENLKIWKDMLRGKYREGECVVRLKTSMKNPNPVFRDPPMLRILEGNHPLVGSKYKVWPLYNFANAVEDHLTGVTHIFRGKEHEHNTWVQERIYRALGWKAPSVTNFGMIYLPGEKMHTRDIKEGIKSGKYSGWDDIKLHTIRSLIRRGFRPEAIKSFSLTCSLSKTDIKLNLGNLEAMNRKIIDPKANRYMVVLNPVTISVKGAPEIKSVKEQLHPDFPGRGKKTIPVNLNEINISEKDWKAFHGKEIRLKGLGNIRLKLKDGFYTDNRIEQSMQKIQWVSVPNVQVEILKPDGTEKGIGEPAMAKLKKGDIIQMERIGFGRIDSKTKNRIVVAFAHK